MNTYLKDVSDISPEYIIKCVTLGSHSVGKSTICQMFYTGRKVENVQYTVGIDFVGKDIKLSEKQNIKLQVWDTAGSEQFTRIIESYIRDVDIAFLVFDMSKRETWDRILKWKEELDKHNKYQNIPLIGLVGCKSDLKHEITKDEIETRAKKWNADTFIISCMKDDSVQLISEMFHKMVRQYHNNIIELIETNKKIPYKITNSYGKTKLTEQSNYNLCCFQ